MSIHGKCSLCGESKDLRLGHVIPQFVIKWQKESSATGFIRSSPVVNRRSQDGPKEHFLCDDCESRFNGWETLVANRIFHPLNRREAHVFQYQSWLLKFAVSISWRALSWYRRADGTEYSHEAEGLMTEALGTWKAFLLDRVDDLRSFHQHMILFDGIESMQNITHLPPNMNRYILRTIEINLALSDGNPAFIFTKMGRMAVWGFLNCRNPDHWKDTKINTDAGVMGGNVIVPDVFLSYVVERAVNVAREYEGLSDKQNVVVERSYRKNIERAVHSETWRALDEDVRLFGEEAAFSKIGNSKKKQ